MRHLRISLCVLFAVALAAPLALAVALDRDGDAVGNDEDNCVDEANANQSDLDEDGIGDACDPSTLPRSKDDCKKDAWRRYGVFRNQGDCVSSVATGGDDSTSRS